jgi:hypothetical protein
VRCGRDEPSQDKGVGSVESGQRDGDEDASHVRRATDWLMDGGMDGGMDGWCELIRMRKRKHETK